MVTWCRSVVSVPSEFLSTTSRMRACACDTASRLSALERLRKTALRARRQPQLAGYGTELEDAAARCSYAVSAMTARREQANARAALSEAHYVMELFGLTTFAWIWLEMALASLPRADHPDAATQAFHRGKLQTCRYVFCHRLVETRTLIEIIVRPDAAVYDMRDAWF